MIKLKLVILAFFVSNLVIYASPLHKVLRSGLATLNRMSPLCTVN